MATIRVKPSQKRALEAYIKVVEGYRGRRLSRGDAIQELAGRALERPDEIAARESAEDAPWKEDPIFKPDFGWHFGRTDAKSINELVYGDRRR